MFENRVVASEVGACHSWPCLPLLYWSICPSSLSRVAFVHPSRFATDFAPSVSMYSKFGRSRVGRRNCNSTPDLVQRNSGLFCSPHAECMQLLIAAALLPQSTRLAHGGPSHYRQPGKYQGRCLAIQSDPLRLAGSTDIRTWHARVVVQISRGHALDRRSFVLG